MHIDYTDTTPSGMTITANDLAASVIAQVCSDPTLEPYVRNALLGTAADLVEHDKDRVAAGTEVACMFERMGCVAIK